MIRRRNRKLDDRAIHRMVVDELIPYTGVDVPMKDTTLRAISQRLNRRRTYVMTCSGVKPCGFVSFGVKSQRLLIDMIAMSRGNQGKGLGRRLLSAAERYGKRRRCKEAVLFVDGSNEGAQRFYDREGYEVTEYLPEIQCYRLAKRLGS
jgi:ribosomal protein S18 acetylase RimI-like enzyme